MYHISHTYYILLHIYLGVETLHFYGFETIFTFVNHVIDQFGQSNKFGTSLDALSHCAVYLFEWNFCDLKGCDLKLVSFNFCLVNNESFYDDVVLFTNNI